MFALLLQQVHVSFHYSHVTAGDVITRDHKHPNTWQIGNSLVILTVDKGLIERSFSIGSFHLATFS